MRAFIRGATRYLFGKRGSRRIRGLRLFYRVRLKAVYHLKTFTQIRQHARVRLFVDGREAFSRIHRLIKRARHTVVIQMFLWKDDRTGRCLAREVLNAADRGVHVDISKEATGDVFELQSDFFTTQRSAGGLWRRFWNHPNIHVTCGTHGDHAKVYAIDDRVLLLTGMNISDEYRYDWHDYLVELRGDRFVEHFLTAGEVKGKSKRIRLIMNTPDRKEIRPHILMLLRNARESIVLEQAYISDPEVLNMLVRKSRGGIRVTLILPARSDIHHYANMSTAKTLLTMCPKNNIQVFLYPKMLHGKVILIDHKYALVGSANLITSSLDDMGEVNVYIEGKHRSALAKLSMRLRLDVLKSRPMKGPPKMWWVQRMLAWLRL